MRGHFECQWPWFGVELPIINPNGQFMLEQRCLRKKIAKQCVKCAKFQRWYKKKILKSNS